jgi:hypothetical protein
VARGRLPILPTADAHAWPAEPTTPPAEPAGPAVPTS